MVFLHMEDGLHNLNHQEHAIESSIQLKMLNHMSSFQNPALSFSTGIYWLVDRGSPSGVWQPQMNNIEKLQPRIGINQNEFWTLLMLNPSSNSNLWFNNR